jgi:hypothetical protein
MRRVVLALVLFAAAPALADGVVNDCKPNTGGSGCACDDEPFHICEPPDMTVPPGVRDMSRPSDLSRPGDEGLDARRERRRRTAASGRGLIVLSGASALAVLALRRRHKIAGSDS